MRLLNSLITIVQKPSYLADTFLVGFNFKVYLIDGNKVYVVDASYTYVWSDGDKTDSSYKAILIAYHDDTWDEDTFLQISLDSMDGSENFTLDDMANIANSILAK